MFTIGRSVEAMIKRGLTSPLRLLGFEIRRVEKNQTGGHAQTWMRVGKFDLLVKSESTLPVLYQRNPSYSSPIGRVAAFTLNKYPDAKLLDIGANVGDTVAIIKSASDIEVLCIEGDAEVFSLLEQNLVQFSGVTAFNVFLDEKSRTMNATLEKPGWNTSIIPAEGGLGKEVNLLSLDDFLEANQPSGTYKILKIDAEGFDPRIIRGGVKYLARSRPIIFFEYNRANMDRIGEDGISILTLLGEFGYDVVLFYESYGRFIVSDTVRNHRLLRQLHDYADGRSASIPYFDLCIFHREDSDLAEEFISKEEDFRRQPC